MDFDHLKEQYNTILFDLITPEYRYKVVSLTFDSGGSVEILVFPAVLRFRINLLKYSIRHW